MLVLLLKQFSPLRVGTRRTGCKLGTGSEPANKLPCGKRVYVKQSHSPFPAPGTAAGSVATDLMDNAGAVSVTVLL